MALVSPSRSKHICKLQRLPVMDSHRQYFIRPPGIGVGHQIPASASHNGVRIIKKPATPLAATCLIVICASECFHRDGLQASSFLTCLALVPLWNSPPFKSLEGLKRLKGQSNEKSQ